MTSSQGDFAQALAGQAQQQTVSIANQITTAALKHVEKAGTQIDASIRSSVNFIEGSNVTLTVSDNAVSDRVDVTVATTNSGQTLDKAQITSPVSGISVTTEGTAVSIIAGNSVAYSGSEVAVRFWCPYATGPSNNTQITLVLLRDSTVLGQSVFEIVEGIGAGPFTAAPLAIDAYDTPAAGNHTYSVKAFVSANSATIEAGAGGSGNLLPAWIRVTAA